MSTPEHARFYMALNALPDHIEDLISQAQSHCKEDIWLEYQLELTAIGGNTLAAIRGEFFANIEIYLAGSLAV